MNTRPAPSLLIRLHSTDSWAAVSNDSEKQIEEDVEEEEEEE